MHGLRSFELMRARKLLGRGDRVEGERVIRAPHPLAWRPIITARYFMAKDDFHARGDDATPLAGRIKSGAQRLACSVNRGGIFRGKYVVAPGQVARSRA